MAIEVQRRGTSVVRPFVPLRVSPGWRGRAGQQQSRTRRL